MVMCDHHYLRYRLVCGNYRYYYVGSYLQFLLYINSNSVLSLRINGVLRVGSTLRKIYHSSEFELDNSFGV